MANHYEYEEAGAWRTVRKVAIVAVVVGVAYFAYAHVTSPGGARTRLAAAAPVTTVVTDVPVASPDIDATAPTTTSSTTAPTPTTTAGRATTNDTASASTTTTTSSTSSTTTVAAGVDGGAPPVTLPDGSAAPVVAIFDVDTITLAGAVPDRAAADRLKALAVANSKTPASVIDLLTVDPSVPVGVGVRVVELTSSRFPTGSAEIRMAHAAELNRMVAVMKALPNVSVLVIGHADQVGSEHDNFALSEERARAVVRYLVDNGIAASRLSSRAVGESDLLSMDDDNTSLALNRRTEFVIYGALVGE